MPLFNPLPLIPMPGMTTGVRYDGTAWLSGSKTTTALVANTFYATPFVPIHASRAPGLAVAVDRLALRVTVASAAGKKGKMGIYETLATGFPGALVSGSATAEFAEDTGAPFDLDQTIAATLISGNLYWLAIVGDGAPTVTTINGVGLPTGHVAINDNSIRASVSGSLTYTAGVTAMPTTAPTTTGGSLVNVDILVRLV